MLAEAENPLIITANAGRDPKAIPTLGFFAQDFAIPVIEYRQRHLSLPADHPCHLGYDPTPFLDDADVIFVIDCDVPWIPSRKAPKPECKVIHIGLDPLFSRYPIRGFPCDIAITGTTDAVLHQIDRCLRSFPTASRPHLEPRSLEPRRQALAERRAAQRAGWKKLREEMASQTPIHPSWVSHCLSEARAKHSILVNEYTLLPEHCGSTEPGGYFGSSPAAGLGWGAGAALGVKLAKPERQVISILGDGSYIFANPVAVHHAATMHRLPVLTIVINNAMWGAVRRATLGMYPDGEAARSNKPPFIDLDDLPAFETICEASGGYGERVEDPKELPRAMKRALEAVDRGQQALINVISRGGAGG
jgi:acetolactate synthase-1/2/3 large subunit